MNQRDFNLISRNPLRELKRRWASCMSQSTITNCLVIPDHLTEGEHEMSAVISSDEYFIKISISKKINTI